MDEPEVEHMIGKLKFKVRRRFVVDVERMTQALGKVLHERPTLRQGERSSSRQDGDD